jgi:hypothetical protein
MPTGYTTSWDLTARSLSEVVGRTTTDSEHTVAGAESSVPNFKKETP